MLIKDKYGLLSLPIGQVLFKMSIPNMIGIFTVLAFNLADTFFISKLGTDALTAISFTFPIMLVITSITTGIGIGVSTNLGRLLGAKYLFKSKEFFHDALILTFSITVILALIGYLSIDMVFSLLGAKPAIISLIHQYLMFWYVGVPLLALTMVSSQGIRATGDTSSAALIMMLAALINLVLDPIFIFGLGPIPRLEIQGAAIASIISWAISFCLSSYFLLIKQQLLVPIGLHWTRIKKNWQQLAHIAKPAALMNLINPIANAILMAMLARIDHSAVAAFGAGTRLESLLLIVIMALSSSIVPFIAQNLGANNPQRAKAALFLSIKFILIFQFIVYIPLAIFSVPIASLFSDDLQVIKWLNFYILALPIAYGPLGIVIIIANSLNAYQRPMASLILNICRLFIVMLPLAAVGSTLFGVKGVLIALPLTNILMGVISYYFIKKALIND